MEMDIVVKLKEIFGEDVYKLQEAVHRMSICRAVMQCGTLEKATLCNQIRLDYSFRNQNIPIDIIEKVYDKYTLEMVGEQLVLEGTVAKVHPDLLPVVEQYSAQL